MISRLTLIFFFLLNFLQAQEEAQIEVQAQVSAQSFYMGQAFTYTILVDGSNKVKPPFINKVTGFAIKKSEERALKSNNKTGYILRYDFIPLESGSLVIPAFLVEVNGKEFTTEEIKISARQPELHSGLKLSILVSQSEVYVGEPFLMTFVWESELPLYTLKAVDVKLPLLQDSAFRTLLPFNAPSGGNKDTIGLPVSDLRMICSHEIYTKENNRREVLKFQQVVLPRYSGEFTIDPASLLCSFIPPSQKESKNQKNRNWRPNYPSYFNNDFFEKTGDVKHERYIAKSNSVKIKVKDLPVDGRPNDFYGIVGKCEVSAKSDQVVVEAGAPLHVTVKIDGYDFPSILSLPDLSKQSTFNRSFAIPKQKSSGEYEKSTKLFTQTLRPLRTDVSAIPPVRIPYFDPQTGTYNVAQSKEIPITVKPAGKVTAFDAELSSETKLKNRLLDSSFGIRHNNLDSEKLNKHPFSLLSKLMLALFIPFCLFILFAVFTSNKRQSKFNPVAFKAKKAYSVFNSANKSELTSLENATREYFADKLNLKADAHTFLDLTAKLNLSGQNKAALKELYEAFNDNRFNRDKKTADTDQLLIKAKTVINEIEGVSKHA